VGSVTARVTANTDQWNGTAVIATRVGANVQEWNGTGSATIATLNIVNVWDVTLADHLSAGSTGIKLNAAASAGDPWITALPGSYVDGTAGAILGRALATPVSANVTKWNGTLVTATRMAANVEAWNGTIVYATTVSANVTQWVGVTPNALISGRVDANTQATAATLTYALTGNITGNLSGSVGSVTGAVGSVTARVTANTDQWNGTAVIATNVDANVARWAGVAPSALISGRVDANTQATAAALTYNLTGNVSGSVGSVTGAVGSVTGAVGSVTARVTANTDQWNGTSVAATNVDANLATWRGATPNALTNSRVPVAAQIQTNIALANFAFQLTDVTTHAPKTSAGAPGCTRSIDGAAFATGTLANVAEIAFGFYRVDFGAGDLNGKSIVLRCTANSSDDTFVTLVTYP